MVSFLVGLLFLMLHLELGTSVTIPLTGYEAERKEVCYLCSEEPRSSGLCLGPRLSPWRQAVSSPALHSLAPCVT